MEYNYISNVTRTFKRESRIFVLSHNLRSLIPELDSIWRFMHPDSFPSACVAIDVTVSSWLDVASCKDSLLVTDTNRFSNVPLWGNSISHSDVIVLWLRKFSFSFTLFSNQQITVSSPVQVYISAICILLLPYLWLMWTISSNILIMKFENSLRNVLNKVINVGDASVPILAMPGSNSETLIYYHHR